MVEKVDEQLTHLFGPFLLYTTKSNDFSLALANKAFFASSTATQGIPFSRRNASNAAS